MSNSFTSFFLCIVLLCSCKTKTGSTLPKADVAVANVTDNNSSEERKFSYADRELIYIMELWPGDYDNVEQLDFDRQNQKAGDHSRMHSNVMKLDLPSFGEHVLFIEKYKNDNTDDITKQGIITLYPTQNGKGINAKWYHLKKKMPYRSITKNSTFLSTLTPESPSVIADDCIMKIERDGMGYRGIGINNCGFKNSKNSVRFRIDGEEYSFYDKPDAEGTPSRLEKSRCFRCMIDFPREEGGRPIETVHYIDIHDQGGKFEFEYKDGRKMVLGMRNTWSFGMQRETFVIFIQEESQKGPTLIYSWGQPGNDRIGFNPGWIRVQCDLKTDKNILLQDQLRPDS